MEEKDSILKKEMNIKSDKNIDYLLKITYSSELDINLKVLNKLPEESFVGNYNMEYIIKNKYFSFCENTQDIKQTLEPILKEDKNIILKEEHDELKLILQLPHPICREIEFILKKEKKDTKDSINELYELINKLNDKVTLQGNEINDLKEKIGSQGNEINDLKEKIKLQEKEINRLKKINNILSDIDGDFYEINNPWSKEKFKYDNYTTFYYTLKENDYLAEKTENDTYMHMIKSMNELKKDNIYKLVFETNYINGNNFHVGFGDFNEATSQGWLKEKFKCVGLTEEGLFIEGNKIDNVSINNNDKKYTFIIDINNKKFSLFVNEIKKGEFNYNFQENIYPLAAIIKIGNSVKIKTYVKII